MLQPKKELKSTTIRRLYAGHFFMVEDELIDKAAKSLPARAYILFTIMCKYVKNKEQTCFPSIYTLGSFAGIKKTATTEAIKVLEFCNMIKIDKVRLPNGKWDNNLYLLLHPDTWHFEGLKDYIKTIRNYKLKSPCPNFRARELSVTVNSVTEKSGTNYTK